MHWKTLYINLDKDTARRESIEKQLNTLGIPFERLSAVDGRTTDYSAEYDEGLAVQKNAKRLTPGEIGCALSHKRVFEQMVVNNIPYALVLEDDMRLPSNFSELVEMAIKENQTSKNPWEYLSFDYPSVGLIFIKRWFVSAKLQFELTIKQQSLNRKIIFIVYTGIKSLYIIPLSILESARNSMYRVFGWRGPVSFYRGLYFTGCYVVTYSGAEKLLTLCNPIVFPADRLINEARVVEGLRMRAYCPLIVHQDRREFGSSILGVQCIEY